jgi:hypothetical protein
VGGGHHDYGWLRGHGAKDVRRPDCGVALRAQRRSGHCVARPGHRIKLQHVLQSHAGRNCLQGASISLCREKCIAPKPWDSTRFEPITLRDSGNLEQRLIQVVRLGKTIQLLQKLVIILCFLK